MDRLKTGFAKGRPPLWLATLDGRRLERVCAAPFASPEAPLTIEFEGITEAEQHAALKAFPGGRRFALAARH